MREKIETILNEIGIACALLAMVALSLAITAITLITKIVVMNCVESPWMVAIYVPAIIFGIVETVKCFIKCDENESE